MFMVFDRKLPDTVPGQLKWMFFLIGAITVASQVAKEYRKYKEKLVNG